MEKLLPIMCDLYMEHAQCEYLAYTAQAEQLLTWLSAGWKRLERADVYTLMMNCMPEPGICQGRANWPEHFKTLMNMPENPQA